MLADGSTHGAVQYCDGTGTLVACCEWSDERTDKLDKLKDGLSGKSAKSPKTPKTP